MNIPKLGPLAEVQCGYTTVRFKRDPAELARIVSKQCKWLTDGEGVFDSAGVAIARSFEDAASAMIELGWIVPPHHVSWGAVQDARPSAEDAVRARLDDEGGHPAAHC
ncbi:hypothetical protein [Nucisporomicrobium flavum]|uniref:hypothetical protein n=1 Tax=Nucisporomicrobium flavum TaxID=2785915 RepID=UPI0018F3722E|nr:hypothetical protein [Nucisporomicrobium flavum]